MAEKQDPERRVLLSISFSDVMFYFRKLPSLRRPRGETGPRRRLGRSSPWRFPTDARGHRETPADKLCGSSRLSRSSAISSLSS